MKKNRSTGDQLGPGLIILALLLVVAGYIGGPALEKTENNRRREIANGEFRDLGDIWKRQSVLLKQGIRLQGPQDLRLGESIRGEFKPLYSEDLEDLISAAVEAVTNEINERFQGRRYVVKALLQYYESGTARVHDIDRPGWSAMSAGLPAEALDDPTIFFDSIQYGDTTLDQIEFLRLQHLEEDEAQRVRDTLNTRFRGTPLRTIDVAGNDFPIGIEASVRMTVDVEEREIPFGFLGILSGVLNRFGLLGLLLLLVSPPVWVYLDARKRRLPAPLWGLFALLTSALGALIYALVTREAGPACPECGERVSVRFVVCPYCQTELKGTCSTCGQTVGLGWHYCPSCATEL